MMDRSRIVVVGNGMAGARAVEEIVLRPGSERFDISVIGEEPYDGYNRILLSGVLSGREDVERVITHPREWYEGYGIDLWTGTRVDWIDRAAKRAHCDDGRVAEYDFLVLATGSSPFVPPIPGVDVDGERRPGVFVFRTIKDCERIRLQARRSTAAVVIGGGLLGLEAAYGLLEQGLEVNVVEAATHVMAQQLNAPAAHALQRTLEDLGVSIHVGTTTAAINGEGPVSSVTLGDGTELHCELVVISAGVRPNTELAKEAGLTVDRGILVNDQMLSTDDPSVYVVGECAQHRGVVYGLVAPLFEQARIVADHLTGTDPTAAYLGSKAMTKLKVMGIDLAVMGTKEPEVGDELVLYAEPARGVYSQAIVRDGILVGATVLGTTSRVSFLTQAFDKETPLPENRAALLFEFGSTMEEVSAVDLPGGAQICNCNAVSKGTILRCIDDGAANASEVMQTTRAGTGCGSCVRQVCELFDSAALVTSVA